MIKHFYLSLLFTASTLNAQLIIDSQGNRTFGGTILVDNDREFACDHGYVDWQIPVNPRPYPLLFVHASSKRTWETAFDANREGFLPIFLRRGYSVYTTDLPRTGQAGQGCEPSTYNPDDQWSNQQTITNWRFGTWLPGEPEPTFYPGVQFPVDKPSALNELYRVQTPEFDGESAENVETDALAVLADEIGPSILLTHSSTGIRGWLTAIKTDNLAAIVSYEPGGFIFPESSYPEVILMSDGTTASPGRMVSDDDFIKLTRMPIQIVWGDFIPSERDSNLIGPLRTLDMRRANVERAQLMVDRINALGGNAINIILPEIGIYGNTHWPMLDLNNIEIAELLETFLVENNLN